MHRAGSHQIQIPTVLPDDGQDGTIDSGDPHGAIIRSQPWLTAAAARAIITIQAGSTETGLGAFIGIGMAEVSSCESLVRKDQPVDPEQQIGMELSEDLLMRLFSKRKPNSNLQMKLYRGNISM